MNIINKIKDVFSKGFLPVYDCNGNKLQAGQICRMKYGGREESKVGYYVIIQVADPCFGDCETGLQTFIPCRHSVLLHDYWSKNLEIIGDEKTHGYLLYNQEI